MQEAGVLDIGKVGKLHDQLMQESALYRYCQENHLVGLMAQMKLSLLDKQENPMVENVLVEPDQVRAAILRRLNSGVKNWQLVAIYNNLAECSVLEVNELTGEIQADADDVADLSLD